MKKKKNSDLGLACECFKAMLDKETTFEEDELREGYIDSLKNIIKTQQKQTRTIKESIFDLRNVLSELETIFGENEEKFREIVVEKEKDDEDEWG